MAYCDVCENFDWEHVDGDPEIVANMTDEGKRNFQPDLYYYWDCLLYTSDAADE